MLMEIDYILGTLVVVPVVSEGLSRIEIGGASRVTIPVWIRRKIGRSPRPAKVIEKPVLSIEATATISAVVAVLSTPIVACLVGYISQDTTVTCKTVEISGIRAHSVRTDRTV